MKKGEQESVDERVAAKFEISFDAAIAFIVFCEHRERL
jgi:hypothetical protein